MEKPKGSGSVSADKKAQEPKDHEVHAGKEAFHCLSKT